MDNWLKGLIAAACIVVIGGVGYLVWAKHSETVERQRVADARAEQAMCNAMISEMKSGRLTHDWRVLHVANCIVGGYLTESDFDTPALKGYLDQARPSIESQRQAAAN